YEKAILTALEEVENSLSAHSRELQRRGSLEASVAANRQALDLALDRYTSGLGSFLSVLDAPRPPYAPADPLGPTQKDQAITLIAVYKALGGDWSFDEDPAAPQVGE